MTKEERKAMEVYVNELQSVADKAAKMQKRVDAAYAQILQKEVETYRELISIWRERLKNDG